MQETVVVELRKRINHYLDAVTANSCLIFTDTFRSEHGFGHETPASRLRTDRG
jgi:hypothetical protein